MKNVISIVVATEVSMFIGCVLGCMGIVHNDDFRRSLVATYNKQALKFGVRDKIKIVVEHSDPLQTI